MKTSLTNIKEIIVGVININAKNAHNILVGFVFAFLENKKAKNNPKGTVTNHNTLAYKKYPMLIQTISNIVDGIGSGIESITFNIVDNISPTHIPSRIPLSNP
ncbi:hypothetical protein [Xenorhabdus bharatensis]|uniref:hypothetical protein n=1 Tax=Xenorhabdus bharatensis TaxID=3136256 RepID=UPI0030F43CFF